MLTPRTTLSSSPIAARIVSWPSGSGASSDTTRAFMTSATISIESLRTSSAAACGLGPDRTITRGVKRRGMVTVKHEPRSGVLSAWIRPPCHSTIDLQIANPIPVPP